MAKKSVKKISKKTKPTAKAKPPVKSKSPIKSSKTSKKTKNPVKPVAGSLQIGEPVPDFSLPGTQGDFHLSDYRGRRLVLFFYPKDATPGCTLEGRDFQKLRQEFSKLGCDIFGISRDSIKSHERYKGKESFEFDLLSDEDEKVCRLFDVIREKNMYGRKVMGIERSTFLLDEQGRLAKEWRKVSVSGHADEVLAAVRAG